MYVAILHDGSSETSITADEYSERFGARGDQSTWLTCPECGQPVVARAMTPGSAVSPYFKHENDNPVAQDCPNYRAGDSYYSGYGPAALGETADMFLEIDDDGSFDLLVGFPALSPWALAYLETAGATISSGSREFDVDESTFSDYSVLYYYVDGPSFGTGIELHGPFWMDDISLPNIKHTLNGSMLFECLGWERRVERLDADSIDNYESDQFTLVYSTMTGMGVATLIASVSAQFKVVGSLANSQDGENEIKVARFITANRDLLKILFP